MAGANCTTWIGTGCDEPTPFVTTRFAFPGTASQGTWMPICVGEAYATGTAVPLIVTEETSLIVVDRGTVPATWILVDSPVPKIEVNDPGETGPETVFTVG